jgi:hypothetical protein
MAGARHPELELLLDTMAVVELTVAGYYSACSRVGGVFGVLCSNLKQQELHHASYMRTLNRWVQDHPQAFKPARPASLQALQGFIKHVRGGTERVNHAKAA